MKIKNEVNVFKKNKKANSRSCFERLSIVPKQKRSQAEVITTVLLVLLGIVAVIIIISFVIPFIKNQISESDCFKVSGKATISNNYKYTCYDTKTVPATPKMRVQVHFGDNASLAGFAIEIGGATTKTYQVKKEGLVTTSYPSGVVMYPTTSPVTALEVPGKNEERTYQIDFSTLPEKVKVYPILTGGRLCEAFDEITAIQPC